MKTSIWLTVTTSLLGFIFVLIPLLYSGRTLLALFILEIIGLSLVGIIFLFNLYEYKLGKLAWSLLGLILIIPLIYLIPLSQDNWVKLPGRENFLNSIEWLKTQDLKPYPYLAFSIIPYKTVHAFLAMIPLVAIVIATASLDSKNRYRLVVLMLLVASFQAVLALVQYLNPTAEWLAWLDADTGRSAQGTYRNRDHLATLMVMCLPMAIGLMIYSIGLKNRDFEDERSNEWRIGSTLFYLFLLMLILVGAIFTRSRAGVLLTILALVITLPIFASHMGGRKTLSVTATLLGLGAAILGSIGLVPVLNRFIVTNPAEDERWRIFNVTIQGIKEYFPLGTGPSTFQEIYRTMQPIEQLKFINHAHNDYLELLLEIGVLAIVVVVLAWIVYLLGWATMWGYAWDRERILKVGAGIGMLMFMLHAVMEFTSHTPANAMFFAFLAGLFLKLPSDRERQKQQKQARKKRSRAVKDE